MDLLRLSRQASRLTKEAEPSPVQPIELAGSPTDKVPHGLDGRLQRPAVGGVGLKHVQGPRNYGPRIKKFR